jgi:carbon-monoxide dehydrogenase medium subunit
VSFQEIARTHGAFALAGAAALVHLGPDRRIDRAALALCGVGPTPYAASWLAEMTSGQEPGDTLFEAVGARVRDEIAPSDDGHARAEYRRRIAQVLTGRVLSTAAARANGGASS